jgi:aryl-alcohol dehydrogenase-like predicted oxidoreductase
MRYKLLGKSGLRVSELCLRTMTFGQDWGWGSSKEESRPQVLRHAAAERYIIGPSNRRPPASCGR